MEEYPLKQSSWGRARQDTVSSQRTARFMWGGEGVLAVAGGSWLVQIAPSSATTIEIVGRSVISGLGGLITAILIVFAWNVYRAPYKQRDEARANLLEKQKPTPISNIDTLVRAISNFRECAIVEFTHHQMRKEHSCKVPDCPLMMDGTPFDLAQAYEALAAEALVAGERAKSIVSPLMVFVLTQITEQYDDESSSVTKLNSDEFLSELSKTVRKTVRRINNLTR